MAKAPAKKTASKKPVKKTAPKTAQKTAQKKAKKAAPKAKASAKPKVKSAAPKAKAKSAAPKAKAPVKATPKNNVVSMERARQIKSANKAGGGSLAKVFTPLDDRVVVERAGVSDRTPGGIIIPDSVSSERPNRGIVVAVGRGHKDKKGRLRPLDVQMGDTVMFTPHSGSELNLGGEDLLILREAEIIAVVKD